MGESGLTLIEVTLMLVATTAIVAALSRPMAAVLQDVRVAAATTYMTQLRDAILNCLDDIGFPEFKVDGDGKGKGDDRLLMLVSDGDIPSCNAAATDGCGGVAETSTGMCCTTRTKSWVRPVDADSDGATSFTFVDFFDRHLILDAPGNSTANAYVTAWRGAYMNTPISADPWGNRYMFSAENLNLFPGTANVLSAGPDEQVDTTWDTAVTTAGADDLVTFVQ